MHHLTKYFHPQNILISLHDTRVWCSEDRIITPQISFTCQQISRIFVWYDENCVKNIFAEIGCSAKSAFSQKRAKSSKGVRFFMLATSEISGKKTPPPGAFAEIPLYNGFIYKFHSLYMLGCKPSVVNDCNLAGPGTLEFPFEVQRKPSSTSARV